MIDIHSHILPGVDDGARSMEEALHMIRRSYLCHTDELILTPHGNRGDYENYDIEKLKAVFKKLCLEAEKLTLPDGEILGDRMKLHLGMEVFGSRDLDVRLREKKLMTMCDSGYMLIEFPFEAKPDYMVYILNCVRASKYIPIIAHAERYVSVQRHPKLIYQWNRMGFPVQLNGASVLGLTGREEEHTAHLLLRHNLVQFIATDCHGTKNRTSGLKDVWRCICEMYSDGYAELLMQINPERLIHQKKVLIVNPISF